MSPVEKPTTTTTTTTLLVDMREAARMLSVSSGTIYNMTKAGELPCVRIRRSVRYAVSDLTAWIAARSCRNSPASGIAFDSHNC